MLSLAGTHMLLSGGRLFGRQIERCKLALESGLPPLGHYRRFFSGNNIKAFFLFYTV